MELAASYQAAPYHDFSAFLADVNAVCFAVPPDVQAPMATQAARAGKHLLLEKPVALTDAAADAPGRGRRAGRGGVGGVLHPAVSSPDVRAWLAGWTARGGWAGGVSAWLGSALREADPFNTPWRNDQGGLWDIGPHMVSLLWASLGPVTSVTADAGRGDITHLVLHHQGGATSTATVTLSATGGGRGLRGVRMGRARPVGRARRERRPGHGAAHRAGRAHRRARGPARVIPATCGSAGMWAGPGRGAAPDRRAASESARVASAVLRWPDE